MHVAAHHHPGQHSMTCSCPPSDLEAPWRSQLCTVPFSIPVLSPGLGASRDAGWTDRAVPTRWPPAAHHHHTRGVPADKRQGWFHLPGPYHHPILGLTRPGVSKGINTCRQLTLLNPPRSCWALTLHSSKEKRPPSGPEPRCPHVHSLLGCTD